MTRIEESQLASAVLMIMPVRFESNPMTAASNVFQGKNPDPPEKQQRGDRRECLFHRADSSSSTPHVCPNALHMSRAAKSATPAGYSPLTPSRSCMSGLVVVYCTCTFFSGSMRCLIANAASAAS